MCQEIFVANTYVSCDVMTCGCWG